MTRGKTTSCTATARRCARLLPTSCTGKFPRLRRKGAHPWAGRLAAVAVLLFVILFATLGPVRAGVLEWVKTIAGFNVEEQEISPLAGVGESTPAPQTPLAGATQPAPAQEASLVYLTPQPLPEVLQNPPFAFGLPQYVPAGYVLNQDVVPAPSGAWVSFAWQQAGGNEVEMLVQRSYSGYTIPAGVDSVEEIQVEGTPAMLVRGFWDEQHHWDPRRGAALHLVKDGVYYVLTFWSRTPATLAIQPVEDLDAAIDLLERMAASLP